MFVGVGHVVDFSQESGAVVRVIMNDKDVRLTPVKALEMAELLKWAAHRAIKYNETFVAEQPK
jgi:hypothetical protein